MTTKIVFAKDSYSTVIDGARIRVSRDEAFYDTDAAVKANPDKFVDVPSSLTKRDEHDRAQTAKQERFAADAEEAERARAEAEQRQAEAAVEEATANPGERRAAKRPAKRTASKS